MASPTLPASCAAVWWGVLAGQGGKSLRRGVKCPGVDGKLVIDIDCNPAPNVSASGACPVGWSSAYASQASTFCCPSQYGYSTSNVLCISQFGISTTMSFSACPTDNSSPSMIPLLVDPQASVFASAVVITPFQISATSTLSSISTPAQSSNSNIATPDPSPTSGLSAGAIAGIVIGAVALLALICLAVFLLLRRHGKKKLASPASAMHTNSAYSYNQPELLTASAGAGAGYGKSPNGNLPTNAFSELPSNHQR